MTPNEKLVWAAAFAAAHNNFDESPAAVACSAVWLLRRTEPVRENLNDEAKAMLEEMRRDA